MCSSEQSRWPGKAKDGKVFKRITGRLCQTSQDKEITFTNPAVWCPPHKMSLSSAIIEQWAGCHRARVIFSAPSILTFKVSRHVVSFQSVIWNVRTRAQLLHIAWFPSLQLDILRAGDLSLSNAVSLSLTTGPILESKSLYKQTALVPSVKLFKLLTCCENSCCTISTEGYLLKQQYVNLFW